MNDVDVTQPAPKPRSWLTNSWMNSVDYLAAMAHVGWAALIIVATRTISQNLYWTIGASLALVAFAALKEFWFDARYELPKQTTKDNVQDFCGYLGGIALAWLVILVAVLA